MRIEAIAHAHNARPECACAILALDVDAYIRVSLVKKVILYIYICCEKIVRPWIGTYISRCMGSRKSVGCIIVLYM